MLTSTFGYKNLINEINPHFAGVAGPWYKNTRYQLQPLENRIDQLRSGILTFNYEEVQECIRHLKIRQEDLNSSLHNITYQVFNSKIAVRQIKEKIANLIPLLESIKTDLINDIEKLQNIGTCCDALKSALSIQANKYTTELPMQAAIEQVTPWLAAWQENEVTLKVAMPTSIGMEIQTENSTCEYFIECQEKGLGIFQKKMLSDELLGHWREQALQLREYLTCEQLLHTECSIENLDPYTIKVVYYQTEKMPLPYCRIYWHDGQELRQSPLADLTLARLKGTIARLQTEFFLKNHYFEYLEPLPPINNTVFKKSNEYKLVFNKENMQLHLYYPSQDAHKSCSESFDLQHIETDSLLSEPLKDMQKKIETVINQYIKKTQEKIEIAIKQYIDETKKTHKKCLYEWIGLPSDHPDYIKRISLQIATKKQRGHTLSYWDYFKKEVSTLETASLSHQSVEQSKYVISNYQMLYQALSKREQIKFSQQTYVYSEAFEAMNLLVVCGKGPINGISIHFSNPVDPKHVLCVDLTISGINKADLEELINKKLEEIQNIKGELSRWQVDVQNFLKQGSALRTTEVPPQRTDIELRQLLDYFDRIDFDNPQSPNYLRFNDNKLTPSILRQGLETFIHTITNNVHYWGMPPDISERQQFCKSIRAITSHLIYDLEREKNPKQVLQIVLSIAVAAQTCATAWLTAVLFEYNTLNNTYSEDMHDDYPLQQAALAWGDALKYRALQAMATEPLKLDVEGIAIAGQTHSHNSHFLPGYMDILCKQNYHIPYAEVADYKDAFSSIAGQGNYLTPEDIELGYQRLIHAPLCIDYYMSEKFCKTKLASAPKITSALIDLLSDFAEKEILQRPEYADLKTLLDQVIAKRDEALKPVKQVSENIVLDRVAYQLMAQWLREDTLKGYSIKNNNNDFEAYRTEICKEMTKRIQKNCKDKRQMIIEKALENLNLYSIDDEGTSFELTRAGVIAILKQLQIIVERPLTH